MSDYVSYEEIDSTHVNATINYNQIEGTGVFIIDEQGKLVSFESDERQEEIDGKMTALGWRAEYTGYAKKNALLIPNEIRVIKVYPDKEVVYFDSNDMDVTYYK